MPAAMEIHHRMTTGGAGIGLREAPAAGRQGLGKLDLGATAGPCFHQILGHGGLPGLPGLPRTNSRSSFTPS